MNDTASTVNISLDQLKDTLWRIFAANGCSASTARILANNCAESEAAGSFSHGIFRIDGYVATLRSGWVDGKAEPVVASRAPGYLHVDARNGFVQPAFLAARDEFTARIRKNGIAFLSIFDSHHFGALWPGVTPFAEEGLIAISMVNSFACAIPAGANAPLLGTNPLGFAAPIKGGAPFVFDFATTSMANGDVQIAAREYREVPPGTGVDRDGQPTRDPKAILDGGSLIPFGGHKGSAISLMIEILVAGMTGGQYSSEVNWSDHPGAQTPRTGQIFIGIDPACAATNGFALRASYLMTLLSQAGFASYPGSKRYARRARSTVSLARADWKKLENYARERL